MKKKKTGEKPLKINTDFGTALKIVLGSNEPKNKDVEDKKDDKQKTRSNDRD